MAEPKQYSEEWIKQTFDPRNYQYSGEVADFYENASPEQVEMARGILRASQVKAQLLNVEPVTQQEVEKFLIPETRNNIDKALESSPRMTTAAVEGGIGALRGAIRGGRAAGVLGALVGGAVEGVISGAMGAAFPAETPGQLATGAALSATPFGAVGRLGRTPVQRTGAQLVTAALVGGTASEFGQEGTGFEGAVSGLAATGIGQIIGKVIAPLDRVFSGKVQTSLKKAWQQSPLGRLVGESAESKLGKAELSALDSKTRMLSQIIDREVASSTASGNRFKHLEEVGFDGLARTVFDENLLRRDPEAVFNTVRQRLNLSQEALLKAIKAREAPGESAEKLQQRYLAGSITKEAFQAQKKALSERVVPDLAKADKVRSEVLKESSEVLGYFTSPQMSITTKEGADAIEKFGNLAPFLPEVSAKSLRSAIFAREVIAKSGARRDFPRQELAGFPTLGREGALFDPKKIASRIETIRNSNDGRRGLDALLPDDLSAKERSEYWTDFAAAFRRMPSIDSADLPHNQKLGGLVNYIKNRGVVAMTFGGTAGGLSMMGGASAGQAMGVVGAAIGIGALADFALQSPQAMRLFRAAVENGNEAAMRGMISLMVRNGDFRGRLKNGVLEIVKPSAMDSETASVDDLQRQPFQGLPGAFGRLQPATP